MTSEFECSTARPGIWCVNSKDIQVRITGSILYRSTSQNHLDNLDQTWHYKYKVSMMTGEDSVDLT